MNENRQTSFLNPHDLLTLSLVSKHLYEWVALENVHLTAFARYFCDLDPETALAGEVALLLRRSEPTWKREYMKRYNAIW